MSPNRVTCSVEIHPHTEELEPRGTVEKRNQREVVRRQKVQGFEAGVLQSGTQGLQTQLPLGSCCGVQASGAMSRKALPTPHPSVLPAHWMVHLSRSRAWPSRRTLALMYLRSLLTLGRRAKGDTMP